MKIGILGAGMIGGTLGRLWSAAGHDVLLATRHPEELASLIAELGPRARAGSSDEAVRFGDVILLAIPLGAVPELGRASDLTGKLVLDACNAYPSRDGGAAHAATSHATGSSGWVASHLPGARVVKAFNTVYFQVLLDQAHQGDDRVGIPLAGDDSAAVATAADLVRDAGFAPVRVGPLAQGKRFEPGASVYNTGMRGAALATALGVPAVR